jgi:hypothetical protein
LNPTEDEVAEVYAALEQLLQDPNPGYEVPSLLLGTPGLRRIDVGKFAAHYETNGTVYLHEIFIPVR